jgi:glycosyltransferase involved in cell wall biosynthesis
MKVCYYLFFPASGIAKYTHELAMRISRTGIETELVCLPSFLWRDEADYPLWCGLREIGHASAWRRKARFLAAQVANPRRLCRRVAETRPDIVHLANINHLTFPLWKKGLRKHGAKIVATVHDVRRRRPILNRWHEDRQLKGFYRYADALFVHSQAQADDLADFAQVDLARVHVLPHGPYHYGTPAASVQDLRRRLGWPQDKQVTLFFGNLRDDKNLELLLSVMPRFRDRLYLAVAGRGGTRGHRPTSYYRELTARWNLEGCVEFRDEYIADEQVAEMFTACDWVALPYSREFTSQSGVLNVAVGYGKPALLSGSPTFAETYGQVDLGELVEPDDAEALAAGIERLARRVARNDRFDFERYGSLFGWDENVRTTLAVYESLVGVGQHVVVA